MTDAEKIRRLPWGVAADALTTVFGYLTIFGNPFILMLGVLGLPKTQIGLLLSLFPFFGVTSLVTAPYVARFGFKRTFITFWTLRYFVVLLLLLLPYVVQRWGTAGAFYLTAATLAAFAFCRAVGETAGYPWSQETIPHSVRAKYLAVDTIVASLVGALSLALAGWVIGRQPGLQPFMVLMAVGTAFGFAGVWAVSHLPGGAPLRDAPESTSHAGMMEALRDRNFLRYLLAGSTFTLAVGPGNFLPLYLEQQIGLSREVVVWLQIAGVAGTVATSYFWGWATDRYGGKPVVLTALPFCVLMPIFWFMLPRHSPWSAGLAALLFAFGSALWMGWALGTNRLLFVKIVPPERKTQYMAGQLRLDGRSRRNRASADRLGAGPTQRPGRHLGSFCLGPVQSALGRQRPPRGADHSVGSPDSRHGGDRRGPLYGVVSPWQPPARRRSAHPSQPGHGREDAPVHHRDDGPGEKSLAH